MRLLPNLLIFVFFLFMKTCLGQTDQSFLVGTWTGNCVIYGAEYNVEMVIENTASNEITANARCKLREKMAGAKKNFTIRLAGTFSAGRLTLTGSMGSFNCPFNMILDFTVTNNVATIKEFFDKGECGYYVGGITVSKVFNGEELTLYHKLVNKSISVTQTTLNDEDHDGALSIGEQGCLVFSLYSKPANLNEKTKFLLISSQNSLTINNLGTFNEIIFDGNHNLSFSIANDRSANATNASYKLIYVAQNDSTVIAEGSLSLKNNMFKGSSPIVNTVFKNKIGKWLDKSGLGILEFKNNNEATFVTYNKKQKRTQTGKWRYISDHCNNLESIAFYDFAFFDDFTFFRDTGLKLYQFKGDALNQTNEEHFSCYRNFAEGGFNEMSFYRLEDFDYDDSLIGMLDAWVAGKWEAIESTSRYNFKDDHQATQYNLINQSDMGSWFWTYRRVDKKLHVFLWLSMGNVFGTTKYEVDLEKSSEDLIYLKSLYFNDAKYFALKRNNNLNVPETIVGLRLDQILRGVVPLFLTIADDTGFFRELYKTVNSNLYRNRNVSIYQELLKQ